MRHFSKISFACAAATTVAFAYASTGAAAVPSVTFNGNVYYAVDGNNKSMDSGDEVCKSMGKTCLGYKSINTNSICKLFHPTAKELVSVNGSKAGFYCNGAPQQGLACASQKNTCQVCPNCNLNEAASCSSTIGQHFKEMYVWCGGSSSASSKKATTGTYGPMSLPKSSARASSSRRSSSVGPDSRIGSRPGYKVCEYYQATKVGDPVRATKKLVSCGVAGLGDKFCQTSLNNPAAKALKCEENGIVICGLPCTTPGARNDWFCSADINRPRGTMVKPLDFCPPIQSSTPAQPVKKPGELCQHGGQCTTGNCIGIGPDFGKEYRCSCNAFRYETGCSGVASSAKTTNKTAGEVCQHGGECKSGYCLGVVPGREYRCSCKQLTYSTYGC